MNEIRKTGEDPLVSVVIPSFNRVVPLQRSVASVLEQGYRNIEVILIDDGSTDGTEQSVLSIQDARLRYIKNAQNMGHAASRNIGIQAANGIWIAFQDSDDVWLKDKLEKNVRALQGSPDSGAVFSPYYRIENGKRTLIPRRMINVDTIADDLLRKNCIGTPTAVVRRDILEKVGGFDEAMPRFADWELFIRISRVTDIVFLEEPLVEAWWGGDNVSLDAKSGLRASIRIFWKHIFLRKGSVDLKFNWTARIFRLADECGIRKYSIFFRFLSLIYRARRKLKWRH